MPRPPNPIEQTVVPTPITPEALGRVLNQGRLTDAIPILAVKITAAAEAANVRTFTLQLVDRARKDVHMVAPVKFWISTTDGGPPSGAQTVAITAGTTWLAAIANQAYEALTDTTGKITVQVTVVGAASRFVQAAVSGIPTNPDAFAWT